MSSGTNPGSKKHLSVPSDSKLTLSSPQTPKINTPITRPVRPKSESSITKVPKTKLADQTARYTRSTIQKAQSAAKMALKSFTSVSDRLSQFETNISKGSSTTVTLHMYQVHLDHVRALWEKVEQEYEVCSNSLTQEGSDDLAVLQGKYDHCYSVYVKCAAHLSEKIEDAMASRQAKASVTRGCVLPPCDTEVFSGDYLKWPTFRDLFTAMYVENPRISDVEKLFHLNAKTSGEAKEIVSKSPLTNAGFQSAWSNLKERFENKRLLVNSQLKVLFNLASVFQESGAALKKLQSTIQGCLTALKLHQISIENWDCILVFICGSKLPKITRALFEQSLTNKTEIPSWLQLDSFLSERYRTLEAMDDSPLGTSTQSRSFQKEPTYKNIKTFETKVSIKTQSCKVCSKENHPIRLCPRFVQMPVNEREGLIKQLKLCLNCFARGHILKDCSSAHNCYKCKGRHNTLLHRDAPSRGPTVPISSNQAVLNTTAPDLQSTSSQSSNIQNYFATNRQGILLGTALINVCHLGSKFTARALIDSGSEATFISERLFKLVKLPYQSIQAQVSGLNRAVAAQPHKLCHFHIGSPSKPRIQIEATAFVLPHLAGNLPSYNIEESTLKDLPDLQFADPSFYQSAQIDVLIGADLLPSIWMSGFYPNICGTLLGQETIFGWILTGPVSEATSKNISAFSTQVSINPDASLEKLLTKFWEVEDVPVEVVKESDTFCENNFVRTTRRNEDGRYIVTLPFQDPNNINLGHSRSLALAQFLRNESRLKTNIQLKDQYDSVIKEYLTLGHMKQVPPSDNSNSYYLPHHAVFKPDSTTTQVRVVFNASNPTSNGKSLNDLLHPGPVLQSDLTLQILRWRFFRHVFNADITKMYRQILVDPQHTRFQRILFRNQKGELCDFELSTVTFGVNCAPFLAIRVLRQLSQDILAQYPLASDIIAKAMYVDDVLAGAHTQHQAKSAIAELRMALESAGFPLRKWTSNTKDVLSDIPKDHLLCADFLEIDDASTAKTLGIRWHARSDEFYFSPSTPPLRSTYTKREVLSQISKLFDPAGWLAPFVVQAKIFMQEIWLLQLGWDDPLPSELIRKWVEFVKSYPRLSDIRIPRWVGYHPEVRLQYHGFCDASQRAYGAAIYARVETKNEVSIHLLSAKSRVAPVKTVSLPRLELCGAVLLAELSTALFEKLPASDFESYYWTDSTIVLAWLNKPPCKWTTFVANRVTKITQSTDVSKWSHVRSEFNPADLASRGLSAQELVDNDLWWHGPEWLPLSQSQWPISVETVHETDVEQRAIKCNFGKLPPVLDILDRFSSFDKAIRVMTYVMRFINSCKRKSTHVPGELSAKELSETQEMLIVATQRREFPKEYSCLASIQQIPSSSSILNLNPFIDSHGVLRACGRARASDTLSYDERHPVIIPYTCQFARLLVRFTHHITLHGGNQLVIRLIRAKYWIPKLRILVKTIISSCKVCLIHKKKLQTQLMGDLPAVRTTWSRPFTHTGVDFAGPFDIKNYTGRACLITKGYVCVFVCFTTKAIHLEATSDLTTEKFLAAFARFVARRGCPQQMYSDNGKTFVGASKALSRDFLEATKKLITEKYSHQSVSWRFNPPSAPHMGGLWEAGVKSFKTLFYKSTSTLKYTFEELSTLLSKIEACLNSRPLSPMSEDPTDLLSLSPGHFLVGGPLLSVSEPEITQNATSILNRWQRLKALNQQFCFRWKEEYLKELHKRNKWQFPSRNIQIGDMVIIKEDNIPTNEWRLGRVQKTYPGSDDKVRVVDVMTARGLIKRPIAKLILLPIDDAAQPQPIN